MTRTTTVELDEALLASVGMSAEEFVAEMKFLAAAKLYELGKISSGMGARLCGMGRVEFLLSLSRVGVPMSNLTAEDLEDDLKFARG